jgi:hypothetical protein
MTEIQQLRQRVWRARTEVRGLMRLADRLDGVPVPPLPPADETEAWTAAWTGGDGDHGL